LYGWSANISSACVARQFLPHERLALLHQFVHPGLDAFEVVRGERALHVEVVVEAVLHRWPDRPLGAREQVGDGLGHQVGHGVAQDGAPLLGVGRDGVDVHDAVGPGCLGNRAVEVPLLAGDAGSDDLAADGLQGLQRLQRAGVRVHVDLLVAVSHDDLVRHDMSCLRPRSGRCVSSVAASVGLARSSLGSQRTRRTARTRLRLSDAERSRAEQLGGAHHAGRRGDGWERDTAVHDAFVPYGGARSTRTCGRNPPGP
jgi:hypothetical protein